MSQPRLTFLSSREFETPIILPLSNNVTRETVEGACPDNTKRIYACDFYVNGIELDNDRFPGGYRSGRIYNIDHHAPTPDMQQPLTSTKLALKAFDKGLITSEAAYTVINHTDCDSMLSSALVMDIVPASCARFPDVRKTFVEASFNADHTGEEDPVADLLQGLDEQRHGDRTGFQFAESLRNLQLFLEELPLEPAGKQALKQRKSKRLMAKEVVQSGRMHQVGRIAFTELSEEIDGALFIPLLPTAWVIMLVSPHPDYATRHVVKLRLGKAAPKNFSLNSLDIKSFDPAFGGRWNAGSNKRGGGTELTSELYRRVLVERIDVHAGESPIHHR